MNGVLRDILPPRDTDKLRLLMDRLEIKTQSICPLCHGGVNKWGHTPKCPLVVVRDGLREQP